MIPLSGKPEATAKVLVFCRNRLLRESVGRIVAKKTGFEVTITDGFTSLTPVDIIKSGSDIIVLDSLEFLLSDWPSLSASPDLHHPINFVLIAMEDDHNRFLAAVRHGARGYVLQDASAADVVTAIRVVADGHAVCPPHYTRFLFDCVMKQLHELPNSRDHERWGLTRREQQLVPLIGRGLSNKEIANHFGLSEQTVKNHLHRILRKVGVSDRMSIYDACQNRSISSGTKDPRYLA